MSRILLLSIVAMTLLGTGRALASADPLAEGRRLFDAGRLLEASRRLSELLERRPSYVNALKLRALSESGLGDFDAAVRDYGPAILSSGCDLIVNATPLGQAGEAAQLPLDAGLLDGRVVCDLAYRGDGAETGLIAARRGHGGKPATIAPGPIRRVRDFPADAERLTAEEPTGIRHVLVNGTPIRRDGVSMTATISPRAVASARVARGTSYIKSVASFGVGPDWPLTNT
jgi:hypothetical protein